MSTSPLGSRSKQSAAKGITSGIQLYVYAVAVPLITEMALLNSRCEETRLSEMRASCHSWSRAACRSVSMPPPTVKMCSEANNTAAAMARALCRCGAKKRESIADVQSSDWKQSSMMEAVKEHRMVIPTVTCVAEVR